MTNKLKPVPLVRLASALELRIGMIKSMIRDGIITPIKQRRIAFMTFDPRAVFEGIATHCSGSPEVLPIV